MTVLQLSLNNAGTTETGVIRIAHPGYTLRVILSVGTPFHASETVIETNHPISGDFGKVSTIKPLKAYSIMEDMEFELPIKAAGAWNLQAVKGETKARPVTFIVDPLIDINGQKLPPGALVIQTDFGRCIGHVEDWLKNLKPISELGYNMIHLPPFQELGADSHYSIRDSLQVSEQLFPKGFPAEKRWSTLKDVMKKIEKELGIVFMADILLNHINPESAFLKEHPEAGYNTENSPHLNPAYYVDKMLNEMSNEIAAGKVPGLPPDLRVEHMPALKQYLLDGFHRSELRKYFTIDVQAAVEQLKQYNEKLPKQFEMLRMRAVNYAAPQRQNILRTRGIVDDKQYKMGSIHVDINYACALYKPPGQFNQQKIDEFTMALNTLNTPYYQHYDSIVKEVVTNVMNTFQYNRYDPGGPKYGPVTVEFPLVWRYFSEITTNKKDAKGKNIVLPLANNGWIFGTDPTDDFIAPGKECYLRRQVVIWGDNVKLNYGSKPEDNPALWDYMTKYVNSVAEVVHAIRLDNAHSTPLPVGEYFIQQARKVNPSLYVMAELFTNSEERDIEYINRLGITSLMREGNKRVDPPAMTHLLWSSGGRPVAAVDLIDNETVVRPVRQIPGVIFDLTHDNEAPSFEPLTTAAAIGMSCSPSGSTRGYDDLLPFNPSVVSEYRTYPLSTDCPALQTVRGLINKLHVEMAVKEMDEVMANYYGNLISIFRCSSSRGEGYWALIRVPGESTTDKVAIPAPIDSLSFEARILSTEKFPDDPKKPIKPSKCNLMINKDMSKLRSVKLEENDAHLVDFPVGTVCIFKTKLPQELRDFLKTLEVDKIKQEFKTRVKNIGLIELGILLFRCEEEEKTAVGHGAYAFPEFGPPFYAGMQGIETAFTFAAKSDAGMGSPVFANIREGNWLMDSMCGRLFQNSRLIALEGFFRRICESLQKLPRFLIPKYVDRLVRGLNMAARETITENCSEFIRKGDDFVRSLAASSISFYTPCKNAQLVHPHLARFFSGLVSRVDCSTSAGFPFFSTGFMRSWGRDTMIALRGLYMVTGRFNDAKDQLIAFAACLRHGLIPNLHDGGMNPRYNARDATWWFLQALQDYAYMSGEGGDVFKWKVPRIFPCDDQDEFRRAYEGKNRPVVTMGDIVQEIMTKHANGIHFTEWNAGKKIDSVMTSDGFNIDIVTDWTNGFILGGNEFNCGTWMDKMGSSEKAKNVGVPATPRDGAAIEIIGLLESALRWLSQCSEDGTYPHPGVKVESQGGKLIEWSQWSSLICANFESWFYVPIKKEHDAKFFIEEKHVGIRGIYKDTVGSSSEFGDYQFRPNLLVAMTVAPELFDPVHAVRCLNIVEERLMGGIGMKTLDPSDYRYRPYYHNGDDTEDFLTSKGFNYHNGPEWVWPVGYFFRAGMRFRRSVTERMKQMLARIKKAQFESWASGLPELTQKDGEPCGDSCLNQAWSVSSILDILYDYSLYTEDEVIQWDVDDEVDELPDEEQ